MTDPYRDRHGVCRCEWAQKKIGLGYTSEDQIGSRLPN